MQKILLFVFLFAVSSSSFAKDDGRIPIVLTQDERNLVLEEMRTFLDTVRSITVSLSKDEYDGIAKLAKKVGMASSGDVPDSLTKKLPKEFKIIAMRVHKAFDQLGLDALDMEDTQQTLQQLGALMADCVACHAIFRLPEPK